MPRAKELTEHRIRDSYSVVWAHGDSALTGIGAGQLMGNAYSPDDLKGLLHFYALFAERLCIPDVCLLHNASLEQILKRPEYEPFLKRAIVVPIVRSSADSLSELERRLQADKLTYLGDMNREVMLRWAEFLDDRIPIWRVADATFDMSRSFEGELLNEQLLGTLSQTPVGRELREYVTDFRRKHRLDVVRRSLLFFAADELSKRGHPRTAVRLRQSASAIYHKSVAELLNLRCAFPDCYSKQLMRAALSADEAEVIFQVDPDSPTDKDLLTMEDLSVLGADAVLALRRSPEAQRYFKVGRLTQDALDSTKPTVTARQYTDALSTYLGLIKEACSLYGTGGYLPARRAQTKLRIVQWAGLGGGIGVSLLGGATGLLVGGPFWSIAPTLVGLFISLGSAGWGSELSSRLSDRVHMARDQWDRRQRHEATVDWAVNRSILGVGKRRQTL